MPKLILVLQPVNGYNIADRIKSANKELFEGDSVQSGDLAETQRKVSFRSEPDYEPDSEPDDATSCDEEDIEAINQVLDRRDDIVAFEEQEVIRINKEELERYPSDQMSNDENVVGDVVADDEVDEICEEIRSVDLLTVSDESETMKNGHEEELLVCEAKSIESNDGTTDIRPKVSKDLKNRKSKGQQPKPSSAKQRQTEPNQHHQHNHRPNSSVHSTSKQSSESQFLKIQLNFKPCCEYKYLGRK